MEAKDMKNSTVSLMIKNMVRQGRFNVCTVDTACDALGINSSENPSYEFLRLAHCLPFEDLSGDEIMNLDYHLRSLFQMDSGGVLLEIAA